MYVHTAHRWHVLKGIPSLWRGLREQWLWQLSQLSFHRSSESRVDLLISSISLLRPTIVETIKPALNHYIWQLSFIAEFIVPHSNCAILILFSMFHTQWNSLQSSLEYRKEWKWCTSSRSNVITREMNPSPAHPFFHDFNTKRNVIPIWMQETLTEIYGRFWQII